MIIHKSPSARQIQPIGFRGRLEASRAPTMGKARKSTKVTASPMMPTMVELSGNRADPARKSSTPTATNMVTQRPANDHASKEVARELIPPLIRSRSFVPSVTTPTLQQYRLRIVTTTVTKFVIRAGSTRPQRCAFREVKRCMLVLRNRARIFRGGAPDDCPHVSPDPPSTL